MVQLKVLFGIILVLKVFGFQNSLLAQTDQNRKLIIVIDPGHGGRDSGAVGINDIKEKDIVLKIAKKIAELNNTFFKNQHEIYLTRYKDTLISLGDRTKIAKALKANFFISLHCNYSVNPNARGVEVYVSKNQGKFSQKSIMLAYKIQKSIKKNLESESRGVKFANFQVLKETNDCFPSALLEIGFLSNNNEIGYYSKSQNADAVAWVILNVIFNYIKH
ncbi:N-acetylmuramoyl-L-alanine amidase family protein [Aequorivita antarctica]|uniref:N-acetylmuramoyl-L-alanine amidase n=1 Tax=Aequorivita antarctica TaxID=153266 RepID=A0A5C6YZU1_9FLAO|nr:N-acetylmuramoyl-L-alanine amidase [Aequorivita antarctica]TXD73305.1 N-acetylmuramoyl-L-alanine amidase [Aequorivita antarctica]SRX74726.1 N-acetylmuramoyl-L-alanine amidase AmiA [Aequorivita antarctica]